MAFNEIFSSSSKTGVTKPWGCVLVLLNILLRRNPRHHVTTRVAIDPFFYFDVVLVVGLVVISAKRPGRWRHLGNCTARWIAENTGFPILSRKHEQEQCRNPSSGPHKCKCNIPKHRFFLFYVVYNTVLLLFCQETKKKVDCWVIT